MIFPSDQSSAEIKMRHFTASKLPVYLLYVFNWIPYKFDILHKCAYVQAIVTAVIHITGLILTIIYVYAVFSCNLVSVAPRIMIYVIATLPPYYQINSFLFLYNSWKEKTVLILNELDQIFLPYIWSTKQKFYMIYMIIYAGGYLITFHYIILLVFQDGVYQFLYGFLNDKNISNLVFNMGLAFIEYLNTLYSIFPFFIGYICICLNVLISKLHNTLDEIILDGKINKFEN